jgi:hypothetical protein
MIAFKSDSGNTMEQEKRKRGRPPKREGVNRVEVKTTIDPVSYSMLQTYTSSHGVSLGELIDAMAIRIAQGEAWPSRLE